MKDYFFAVLELLVLIGAGAVFQKYLDVPIDSFLIVSILMQVLLVNWRLRQ